MPVAGIHEIPAKNWMLSQRNTSFLGLRVMQRWVDFLVWEKLLNKYEGMRSIIELGTYNGAFSTYLYMQCIARGMRFLTFDSRFYANVSDAPVAKLLDLEECFYHEDIFREGSHTIQAALANESMHPLVFFCDNGNKVKEFKTFVPRLSTGDIVGVHDWTEEFGPKDVMPVASLVFPILHEECATVNSITRFWQRQ